MYGGHSGCQGFFLYQKKKESCRGIYGYYQDGDIVLVEDDYQHLSDLMKKREAPYQSADAGLGFVYGLFLAMLAVVILSAVFLPFRVMLANLVFCIISYFPMQVLKAARENPYTSDAAWQQFRRYHGCEHAAAKCLANQYKSGRPTPEQLRSQSHFDSECGTMYSGYVMILAAELALFIFNPLHLGVLKMLGIFAGTIILLFINIFNARNPFFFLQASAVAQPTEKEYALGWAMIERMIENTETNK